MDDGVHHRTFNVANVVKLLPPVTPIRASTASITAADSDCVYTRIAQGRMRYSFLCWLLIIQAGFIAISP